MTYLQPGPIDGSLLKFQDNRISSKVWEGENRMIHLRYHFVWCFEHLEQIDVRI